MFYTEASIVLIPVIGRIEMIGLAIDDGVECAGMCRQGGDREERRDNYEGYVETFLHTTMVLSERWTGRPTRSPGKV